MTMLAGAGSPARTIRDPRVDFEGGLDAFKERQLVFQLVRQLARAQFERADREFCRRLWEEAAMADMDPERIIRLMYGVADHDDTDALEEVDRVYREERRQAAGRGWQAAFRRRTFGGHRSAPPAAPRAHRGAR
jgi:hypothetical protein